MALHRHSLTVLTTSVLFFVIARSAETNNDTCMSGWLTLSGIRNKSVPSYELLLKNLRMDEGNYKMPLHLRMVPLMFNHQPNDGKKLLHCLGKQLAKCRSRPPCGTAGTCRLDAENNYYCKCEKGFSGRFCQNDADECLHGLHNCNKKAKCINNHGSYSCHCKPGFMGNGRQCKEVDECKAQPCANNGTCHDHINRFSCTCRAGFKGKTCNEDIDECLSHPCKNNGTCFNEVNNFTCRCPIQFEGKTCSERWFSGKLFKHINSEHADLSAKVAKNQDENKAAHADLSEKVAKNQAENKAAISTVIKRTEVLENQLKSITQKIDLLVSSALTLGKTPSAPGFSCLDIKKSPGYRLTDGLYWIQPLPYILPYRAYCDMTTHGGGWTLFATKVSYNFAFPATKFSPSSASSTTSNAKGCIRPGTNWSEVLFRFGPKPSPVQTIYSRHGGRESVAKRQFNKFLECATFDVAEKVAGFVKYTPYVNGGKRTPITGYFDHLCLHYRTNYAFSGFHVDNDNFIDLWGSPGDHGNYYSCDSHNACGSKCIAGVCYLNRPVWLMYR